MAVLFYKLSNSSGAGLAEPPPGMRVTTWLFGRDGYLRDGLSPWPAAMWWMFQKFGVFSNRHSGVLLIHDGDVLAHRALVTAGWYRFPAMAKNDLQIGDVWTHPDYRGRGLATQAVGLILDRWRGSFATMWYVVDEDNIASIRVIEKCGFQLGGRGRRTAPLRFRPLGRFVIGCER